MRGAARGLFVLILSGLGTIAPAAPRPADQARTTEEVIDRVITNEQKLVQTIQQYSPLVETYIQNLKPDKELGYIPAGDTYFLGRAGFTKGVAVVSLTDVSGKGKKALEAVNNLFAISAQYLPDGFLQMVFLDTNGFDRQHYTFDYVRREFLGEVRCLVFDVTPLPKSGKGRFLGRIWVEDQDYNIVRFNGDYKGSRRSEQYFHFDSWRMNMQPGLWLPSYVYSQETHLRYALGKSLDFKSRTELWGYHLGPSSLQQELSKIEVETPVQDDTRTTNDLTPLQAQRAWDRQAEDNLIDRMERIGLVAPRGEVDKVLDTVVNNLEVTNNIDVDPEVRCRVLTTTTLESFTLGHTIVLSRGLVDVLPDEASLAAILAHELGHVVLGHRLDPSYGFVDNLLVQDKDTFRHFGFQRTAAEENAAATKGFQILKNSPYKDRLSNAELFLAALAKRQNEIPSLISGHLGNRLSPSAIADMESAAPVDPKENLQMTAALPVGGRVKLDPWNDKLELIKSKPVGSVSEREKMPFEVTPFVPYLTRYGTDAAKPVAVSSAVPSDQKASQTAVDKP